MKATLIDSTTINGDGSYTLYTLYNDSVICCMGWGPIIPTEDYVTTYYPSTIDWEQAHKIYPPDNSANINIDVERIKSSGSKGTVSGMVATIDTNNSQIPLVGATIIAQQDGIFKNSSITDEQGNYTLDSLNNGSCIVLTTKIGYKMDSSSVNVTGNTINSCRIILKKTKQFKNGVQSYTTTRFYLSQNFPNPFNPSTKIQFNIPPYKGDKRNFDKQILVTLIIYDILGREVATLINKQLMPGTYKVSWDARNFSSGIYFYTLRTNTFIQTRKMIIMK